MIVKNRRICPSKIRVSSKDLSRKATRQSESHPGHICFDTLERQGHFSLSLSTHENIAKTSVAHRPLMLYPILPRQHIQICINPHLALVLRWVGRCVLVRCSFSFQGFCSWMPFATGAKWWHKILWGNIWHFVKDLPGLGPLRPLVKHSSTTSPAFGCSTVNAAF